METLGLRLIRLQHLLFWTSFVFITSFVSIKAYPSTIAVLRVAFICSVNCALYLLCYKVLVNHFLEKHKFGEFILIILVTLIITVALRYNFDKGIDHFRFNHGIQPLNNRLVLLGISFFTQATVILIACLLSIAANRFITESKLLEASRRHNELELTMLKTKISPHFLLNTLNNIYYYCKQDSKKGAEAILKLSYLLQYISYEVASKRISLEREIEIIEALNELYAMRFEQTLAIKIELDNNIRLPFEVVPGILVTLFENALKHSGVGLHPEASIRVKITKENDVFTAYIGNTVFEELNSNNTFYSGMGLNAVREMLELEYGSNHNLVLHKSPGNFEATLSIKDSPLR